MKNKKFKLFAILILPLAAIFIAYLLINYCKHPICIWKNLFHVDCWGCGITRAFYSLCKLDFIEAWNYNPRIYIIVPLLIYVWGNELYKLLRK